MRANPVLLGRPGFRCWSTRRTAPQDSDADRNAIPARSVNRCRARAFFSRRTWFPRYSTLFAAASRQLAASFPRQIPIIVLSEFASRAYPLWHEVRLPLHGCFRPGSLDMMFRVILFKEVLIDGKQSFFEKEIRLPFAPYRGLHIIIGEEDGVSVEERVVKAAWDIKDHCFDCTVLKERFSQRTRLLNGDVLRMPASEIITSFLNLGWELCVPTDYKPSVAGDEA
jgi:hypothetical protein